jgi:hypothetical protein
VTGVCPKETPAKPIINMVSVIFLVSRTARREYVDIKTSKMLFV